MLNETAITIKANRVWVSQTMARQLLGKTACERGLREGKLRARKRDSQKQNGRWDYNLLDLLKICDIRKCSEAKKEEE